MRISLLFPVLMFFAACSPKMSEEQPRQGSELGFAIDLFRNALRQSEPDVNVTISPYSAGVALSMLKEGAQGQTRAELEDAMNYCVFRPDSLGSNDTVIVKSANSVWLNDDFSVRNSYVSHMTNEYDAFVDALNFSDPATVHAINNWCSENTEGMIDGVVRKLTPDMVMILANALYFKAPWEKPFDPAVTRNAVFHGKGGDSEVPFMSQKLSCAYAEYAGNQLVSLPYKGGKYSMLVFLPSENMDINGVLPYISERGLNDVMRNMSVKKVRLAMPKFKVESEMSLVKTLEAMGVRTVFTSAADLSMIARGPLCVSDVYQKTVVEVDERGSEAAAVTTVTVNLTSARIQQDPVMTVDRPFYYMIADMDAGRVLFAGRIMNL